ncbi:unnamed protein product [Ranitomeya imitator]|uniref:Uncharacterized protein n=1 Tax=Ranitomeya imitator TaxID=111125 RepID=A0ABN9KTL6_9NEOB|nr:unnamed protein product [Ranitomeya imitator]
MYQRSGIVAFAVKHDESRRPDDQIKFWTFSSDQRCHSRILIAAACQTQRDRYPGRCNVTNRCRSRWKVDQCEVSTSTRMSPKLAGSSQIPCNFIQKYEPLKFSWNSSVSWEKFSFLIMSRGPMDENDKHWPRVVGPVLLRPRHVHCNTCCPDGKLHHDVITAKRHGKDLYRCARKSDWGDRLPAMIANPAPDETKGDLAS